MIQSKQQIKKPTHKKTPSSQGLRVFWNNELAMTYSHMGNPTLPSALRGFTSEFGKGSGGSLLLWSPAQLFMTLPLVLFRCQCLVKSCTRSKQCFELRSLTGIFESCARLKQCFNFSLRLFILSSFSTKSSLIV